MLCERCHGQEATVHLRNLVVSGVSRRELCEPCAWQESEPLDLEMARQLSSTVARLESEAAERTPEQMSAAADEVARLAGFLPLALVPKPVAEFLRRYR